FYRNNRGVTLTAYGVEVYHYAKSIIKQFEIMKDKLLTNTNDNKIKVASFGSEVINFKFYEVCQKYNEDNYEFELCEAGVEESIEKVIERKVDIISFVF
ncbi:MAG: hypothetical protein ACK5JH_10940, partial [Anaerocolumna sp.]